MSDQSKQEKANKWIQDEFRKIQQQMQAEIQQAMTESKEQLGGANARSFCALVEFADQLADRLELHARLCETTTGTPSIDDEELIQHYWDFRKNIPV